jgi:hypothetical protein
VSFDVRFSGVGPSIFLKGLLHEVIRICEPLNPVHPHSIRQKTEVQKTADPTIDYPGRSESSRDVAGIFLIEHLPPCQSPPCGPKRWRSPSADHCPTESRSFLRAALRVGRHSPHPTDFSRPPIAPATSRVPASPRYTRADRDGSTQYRHPSLHSRHPIDLGTSRKNPLFPTRITRRSILVPSSIGDLSPAPREAAPAVEARAPREA